MPCSGYFQIFFQVFTCRKWSVNRIVCLTSSNGRKTTTGSPTMFVLSLKAERSGPFSSRGAWWQISKLKILNHQLQCFFITKSALMQSFSSVATLRKQRLPASFAENSRSEVLNNTKQTPCYYPSRFLMFLTFCIWYEKLPFFKNLLYHNLSKMAKNVYFRQFLKLNLSLVKLNVRWFLDSLYAENNSKMVIGPLRCDLKVAFFFCLRSLQHFPFEFLLSISQ